MTHFEPVDLVLGIFLLVTGTVSLRKHPKKTEEISAVGSADSFAQRLKKLLVAVFSRNWGPRSAARLFIVVGLAFIYGAFFARH
jgi:hypothetical protein